MLQIMFSFTQAENGSQTLVLLGSLGPRLIPESHANFNVIKDALLQVSGLTHLTEAEVYELADAATTVTATLQRLSERVTIRGNTIFFDGDAMNSRLTRHIIAMVREGDSNYEGFVQFLENIQLNPSEASRVALFEFLERNDLVITSDGQFIGYKGVGADGKSITAGREDVTVTLADGTVEVHKGHIPYPVGATVEMARSQVDPDRASACSVGLHVGTFDYSGGWATGNGKRLTVAVNPRDVVAVPSDSGGQKLRAHRLTVLEVNETGQYTGTSYAFEPDEGTEDDWDTEVEWDSDNEYGSF